MQRFVWAAALIAAAPAYAAHPLITEDTATQGKGRKQLEVFGEDGRARGTRDALQQAAAVYSYGVTDRADFQAGLTWLRSGAVRGAGDSSLDLKWRFYERGALSFALKPGITLPTGDDARGLGTGRPGWGTQLVASYDRDEFALHLHGGYRRNRNTLGERESLTHASAALVVRPRADLKLVADVSRDTNPDPAASEALRYVVLGAIWSARPDVDLDAGVKTGHGGAALERAFLFGVTLRW